MEVVGCGPALQIEIAEIIDIAAALTNSLLMKARMGIVPMSGRFRVWLPLTSLETAARSGRC